MWWFAACSGKGANFPVRDVEKAPGRNRRKDRIARGETNRDTYGRSVEDIQKKEQNWLAYRVEKRATAGGGGGVGGGGGAGGGDRANTETRMKEKTMKKAMDKPKKGQDTWGIKERSSWNGGEYKVYGQSAVEVEK